MRLVGGTAPSHEVSLLARYVSRMIGVQIPAEDCVAFGLVSDIGILAGVLFHGYSKPNILMHIAGERLTPSLIAASMHYAFVQCGCKRVTGIIERRNYQSIAFAEKLGADHEGTMREAAPSGDLEIYGLMRERGMRWLTPRNLQKLEAVKTWAL
jgi:hypothetical protein